MNYFRIEPIGIDAIVNLIQKKLTKLNDVFNIEFDAYPRCYVNQKKEGDDYEYFIKKNDYRSVLHAERNKYFFIHDSRLTPTDNFGFETELKLYFIVDLSKIDPLERNESKLLQEVDKIIRTCQNIELINIDSDFQSIFRNTNFSKSFDFLHPYYACCFNLRLIRYELNQKPCR